MFVLMHFIVATENLLMHHNYALIFINLYLLRVMIFYLSRVNIVSADKIIMIDVCLNTLVAIA